MEEPPIIPNAPPPSPVMPLWARMMNIFAIPGAVFEHVRLSRRDVNNWLWPVLLVALVMAVSTFTMASQPALHQMVRDAQNKNNQDVAEKVNAGKMSAEDAEKFQALADKVLSPSGLKVMGAIFGVLMGILKVFGWAFALWFIGRLFFKIPVGFGKMLEVAGLAGMIAALGTVVALLLQVNFSNPAASPVAEPGKSTDFDFKNPLHLAMVATNLFDLWHLVVLAIGLARLSGQPFVRTSFAVVGFWLILMTVVLGFSSIFRVGLG